MQQDKITKIFISYSWSSDKLVLPLTKRLVSHGVDVVLNKWDLKEGQYKNESGKRIRTKKEIQDEFGEIRKDCTMIPKGEIYERHSFRNKKVLYQYDKLLCQKSK